MNFLSPAFLWLLPLISIPIIIHILNQMNLQTVEFSSIKFLQMIEHESIRKLKLIQILLLIVRTIMILLIILMISRPVVKGVYNNWIDDPESTITIIILDNSFSISGNVDNDLRIELVNNSLNKITNSLNGNSNIIISSVTKGLLFSGTVRNIPKILNSIEETYLPGSINDTFTQSLKSVDRDYANYELYIISDGQKTTLNINQDNFSLSKWNTYFIQLPKILNNYSIADVRIQNEFIIPNTQINISVDVRNSGENYIKNCLMELHIDEINVGQQLISINPKEIKTFHFKTALPSTGQFRAKVSLQNDQNIGDNDYYFSITIPEIINIGLFSYKNVYFKNALRVFNDMSNNILTHNILQSNNSFSTYDIILIETDMILSEQHMNEIKIFVKNGGHLIYFPNNKTKIIPKYIDKNFELLLNDNRQENIGSLFHTISHNSGGISFLTKLEDSKDIQVENIEYFKYIPLKNDNNTQLELINNTSIWNRYLIGEGILDVFGFALEINWTTFPLRGSFIPFVNNLIHSSQKNLLKQYIAGEYWEPIIPNKFLNSNIYYQSSTGYKEIINNKTPKIKIESTGFHGIYNRGIKINEISVNIISSEIISKILNKNEIKTLFNNNIVFLDNNITSTIKQARHGTEIWSFLLIIFVLFIFIEMILSNSKRFQNN